MYNVAKKRIETLRGRMLEYLIRHDSSHKNVIEGISKERKAKERKKRSRRSYSDQMREKVDVGSYQKLKGTVEQI